MSSIPERKILLIDMNSYFASIEQVCHPQLKGKPIIVCGKGRTVVITASYEAREYGIKTGMTIPEAKKLCPFVKVVYGDIEKYIDTSLNIHKIFLSFTDKVEVCSIDECFMDVTDIEERFGGVVNIAIEIKKRLKDEFGLTCSIGIGPNKIIAKLAAKIKKPDGLTIISKKEVDDFLNKLPVEQLQGVGIGKAVAKKLKELKINTAGELGKADSMLLTSNFGIMGWIYKKIGQGEDNTSVRNYYEKFPIKSVSHSYTLPADTSNIDVIKSYILMLSEKVGARLREYKMSGKTICLSIKFEDFKCFMKRYTSKYFFNTGLEIFKKSYEIFSKNLLPLSKKIRMISISVTGLRKILYEDYLFDDLLKKQKIIDVVDKINSKYGDFSIKPLAIKIAENFGVLRKCGVLGTRIWKK